MAGEELLDRMADRLRSYSIFGQDDEDRAVLSAYDAHRQRAGEDSRENRDQEYFKRGWDEGIAHALSQHPATVRVPSAALAWLFGEEGEFECPPDRYFRGKPPTYWWRGVFRDMLSAAEAER